MKSASRSIGNRLTRLSVVSSGAALLAVGLSLFLYDLHEVRKSTVLRLQSVAAILALNCASAVDFNDPDAARATLAALETRPNVMAAGIVVDGGLFAGYARGERLSPEIWSVIPSGNSHRFADRHVVVYQTVAAGPRTLGTLFIQASLKEIDERLRRYAAIIGIISVAGVLVTLLISRRLQETISRPILNLASLAQRLSEEKDYSIRAAETRSVSEVEQLVATFNHMLAEIQQQHADLSEARATLEQRVEERTEELAAANRELESFSYSVSHDLRAPLRAIDGFSNALITGYADKPLDQRGIHFLERVRAGTQRMSRLIDDLLHLSRVTRSSIDRKEVDVTSIAQGVAAEIDRLHPDRHVEWRIANGLRAFADPHLLVIVFENLLGNAWKFTGLQDTPVIEVGRTDNGEAQVLYVRDNGAGFDMAYADKLFGAFQRLHDDSQFEGTGIGLATVQRIIRRHGGRIWAEAEEGKGAMFQFTLGEQS